MMSALRHADQIVLAHLMVAEKSNEIPAAPELIEALGVTDCLFTLDAAHCQKTLAQFALAMHAGLTFSIPAAAASTARGEGVRGRTAR